MSSTETIPSSYDEAVNTLARWHSGLRQTGLEIYSFPDPDGAVVRLVEVSGGVPRRGRARPCL
jgi:hypothetical protein